MKQTSECNDVAAVGPRQGASEASREEPKATSRPGGGVRGAQPRGGGVEPPL